MACAGAHMSVLTGFQDSSCIWTLDLGCELQGSVYTPLDAFFICLCPSVAKAFQDSHQSR